MESPDKRIADFLKATNAIERYLHADGPLTPLQHQTIETTIMGLQTLLQSWSRKQQQPGEDSSFLSQINPRKAQGS
jgi:hypothetical protein